MIKGYLVKRPKRVIFGFPLSQPYVVGQRLKVISIEDSERTFSLHFNVLIGDPIY